MRHKLLLKRGETPLPLGASICASGATRCCLQKYFLHGQKTKITITPRNGSFSLRGLALAPLSSGCNLPTLKLSLLRVLTLPLHCFPYLSAGLTPLSMWQIQFLTGQNQSPHIPCGPKPLLLLIPQLVKKNGVFKNRTKGLTREVLRGLRKLILTNFTQLEPTIGRK